METAFKTFESIPSNKQNPGAQNEWEQSFHWAGGYLVLLHGVHFCPQQFSSHSHAQ